MRVRFGIGLMALLVLSGCSGTPAVPQGVPSAPAPLTTTPAPGAGLGEQPPASPAPETAIVVPDVPRQNSSIDAQVTREVVPPVNISVADLELDMPVLGMGVDGDGAMDLPQNTGEAGWYRFGPAPGDPAGTTVIAAHVDSAIYGLGAFARLREVTIGVPVTVRTADGAEHRYTVSEVVRTPKSDVPLGDLFDREGAARLVLVTCGGEFDRSTGHYLDNVIVTAVPE
ncbi:class F sortase [Planctomonas psychrotolerans]|uniref:class F sortase n=1 Tax=Planctomonas psychrotolerans TaxID=2528712 RepID=UPI001239BE97|nr:class F sortase [Planctomonas psychrotolerans]